MIIIKNISLQSDDSGKLYQKLKKILKRDNFNWEIYRKSIDARKGISYNFQVLVDVEISDGELGKIKGAERYSEENFEIQVKNPPKKVAIVGSGPAGLFCAYILSSYGVKVNVYEQGEPVEDRIKAIEKYLETGELNVNSNIQFGEGGAGTFSDGKLTARSKDKRVREVLKIFREHGAPKEIMYDSKPHIGTDILQNVIISMREKIKENGGEYHFSHKFQDME
ncbi:MAG: NAD(P)-binding protein, partial [Peptoniphilus sp.]|uniref:NAD(P)-binding protein n=1 Tax=Peptoniphilus sp. TaxID=1971214 RepID=UPI002A75981A